jgi:DinB superfamily
MRHSRGRYQVQPFGVQTFLKLGRKGTTMKHSLVRIAFVFTLGFLCTAAGAQELTQADRDKAVQYLESTKKDVLDATKDLSPAQWNFKAAQDRWSIAECMEHIAAAEDYIRALVVEKVMLAPAAPGRDVAAIDAAIIENVPARKTKAQAPEEIKPTNRFGSPQGSIDHFVESRTKTETFVKDTPGLRDHAADSPVGTKWDAYEFVLLIAAHSERHTNQIKEVKTDPNYPKS